MIRRTAALFSGQSSQYIGMYKALYEESKIVQETIKEAEQVSEVPIRKLCFEGPMTELAKPCNAHIIIHSFGLAAFRDYIAKTGQAPTFCAGHSLGEYTALACAGGISFSDSIRLVKARAEISMKIQRNYTGGMTIVDGIDSDTVLYACKKQQKYGKSVFVSCINSPTQTAISGIRKDIDETEDILLKGGNGNVSPLFGSAPFHCPLMKEGSIELEEILNSIEFKTFRYPVMSNYTGKPYQNNSKEIIIQNLVNHLISPVQWHSIMRYFQKYKVDLLVDFSSKNMFQYFTNLSCKCYGTKREREEITDVFSSPEYSKHKPDFLSKCVLAVVSTPNRKCSTEDYEKMILKKYEELSSYSKKMCEDGALETDDKKKVVYLLKSILESKGICQKDIQSIVEQIIDETASRYDILV